VSAFLPFPRKSFSARREKEKRKRETLFPRKANRRLAKKRHWANSSSVSNKHERIFRLSTAFFSARERACVRACVSASARGYAHASWTINLSLGAVWDRAQLTCRHTYVRTNKRMDGRTYGGMDERTDANCSRNGVGFASWDTIVYVRSAHIVRRPYVEKNAITPRRIWRQCTGACHPAPLPSSLLPCPRPFVPRSDVRAECQLFLRLFAGLTRGSRYQGTLVPSDSHRPPRSSFPPLASRRWSPSLSPHTAPSRLLKTRLQHSDRRYRIPYPPAIAVSLSLFCVERLDSDILESSYEILLRLCIIWLLSAASKINAVW